MPPPLFEWDFVKSALNWAKHDITLAGAEKLWLDKHKTYDRARSTSTETRYALIAKIQDRHWHCTFTTREGFYRLISCRRARKKEVAAYESRKRGGL